MWPRAERDGLHGCGRGGDNNRPGQSGSSQVQVRQVWQQSPHVLSICADIVGPPCIACGVCKPVHKRRVMSARQSLTFSRQQWYLAGLLVVTPQGPHRLITAMIASTVVPVLQLAVRLTGHYDLINPPMLTQVLGGHIQPASVPCWLLSGHPCRCCEA